MKIKTLTVAVVSALIVSHPLFAQQDAGADLANEKKLTLDLGVALINSTSTLDTRGEKEIEDNTKAGEASNSALILPIFDFRYIFRNTDTEVFVGTPLDGSDLSLAVGVTQPVDDLGKFSLSFAPSLGAEVWKNPYLENTKRKSTPEQRLTTKFAWKGIRNSPFDLTYSHTGSDVEEDDIGDLYQDLERDGYAESVQLTYNVGLSQTSVVSPSLMLEKNHLQGSANNYDKSGMSVKYQTGNADHYFMLELSANKAMYKTEHPIYKETRRDQEAGIFAMLHLLNLFDVEGMHSNIIVGTGTLDSNIDFFDSSISYLAVTLGYSY
ncbi:MAG: DUF2860 domain-containing protein [Proteobacteria bacterium]|nr:DUF2860 domain-containing protein [Pseudomonadota bacterium]